MDQPHKQVMTTSGVAIKAGQTRVHVPVRAMHPWLRFSETIKCPSCDTSYVVFAEFPRPDLDGILSSHHKNKQEHPDVIASAPAFTRLEDCDCASTETSESNG